MMRAGRTQLLVLAAAALACAPFAHAASGPFESPAGPRGAIVTAVAAPGMGTSHAAPSITALTPAALTPITPIPLQAATPPAPGQGPLEFICAKPTDGATVGRFGLATVFYTCPLRVYDTFPRIAGCCPFGNLRLAVQDSDPTKAAFFSLHGPAASGGPTNRSRLPNTHTTFSTTDMGVSWTDSWTSGCPEEDGLGEWATGAMDEGGNVTQAYLWSHGPERGAAWAWPLGPTTEAGTYMGAYCDDSSALVVSSKGARIDALAMAHVAKPGGGRGREVLAYHTAGTLGANGTAGLLEFAVYDRQASLDPTDWLRPANGTVQGCREASDAVAWAGRLYIACVAGPGYTASTALPGDVELWSFDPWTLEAARVSRVPVHGGNVKLAVTPDGYFAAAATRSVGTQKVSVPVAFGWHGKQWDGDGRDLGVQLHQLAGARALRNAHVTALAFAADTKTLFAIYKEWNQPPGLTVPTAPPDPTAGARLTDYKKLVVTLDSCQAPIAASELVLGTSPDGTQQDPQDAPTYDDLQDGLQTVRMPSGEEWVFFAVNDYGGAQFGAIRAASGAGDSTCVVPPPPVVPAVPAIFPQALSTSTAATSLIGTVLVASSFAALLYLLTAKRRQLHLAVTETK